MKFAIKFSFRLLLKTERKRYEKKVDRILTNESTAREQERGEEPPAAPLSPVSERLVRETTFSEEQINRIFAKSGGLYGTSEGKSHGEKVESTITRKSFGSAEDYKEERRVIPLSPTSERLIRETRFSAEHIKRSFAKARGLDPAKDDSSP